MAEHLLLETTEVLPPNSGAQLEDWLKENELWLYKHRKGFIAICLNNHYVNFELKFIPSS